MTAAPSGAVARTGRPAALHNANNRLLQPLRAAYSHGSRSNSGADDPWSCQSEYGS